MKNPDIERVKRKWKSVCCPGQTIKQIEAAKTYYTALKKYKEAEVEKNEQCLKWARSYEAVGDWIVKMPTEGER